jgi:hypothetical protein
VHCLLIKYCPLGKTKNSDFEVTGSALTVN